MKVQLKELFYVASLIALTACGGGGGGGGGGAAAPAPAGVSITEDNAVEVTGEVIGSVEDVEGSTVGTELLTGVVTRSSPGGFSYPGFFIGQLELFDTVRTRSLSLDASGVAISESVACTDGGSATVSGDVADPSRNIVSTGDTLALIFSGCAESGVTISGRLDMRISAVSGADLVAPFSVTIAATLSDFSVSGAGETLDASGDMRMSLADDGLGNLDLALSGNRFTVSDGKDTVTLTSYHYTLYENEISSAYSYTMQGSVESTLIGGTVSFSTQQEFAGTDPGFPAQGVLLISAGDGSEARVSAQPDGINVQIEVDADGDGSYEQTIMTTWAELDTF